MSKRYNHYNRYNHNNYYKGQRQQNNYQQQSNNQVEYQQQNQIVEPTQVVEQSESIEQQTKNKHVMLSIIGVAILVIGLVGITYAIFNYTRTGSANVIKTGKIAFATDQDNTINLTNMFPIEANSTNLADATKVGTVTIDITGDTTYDSGVEYLVTATNVSNTVNNKSLPISIEVTYAASENKSIGTASDSYFAVRGGNTSCYKVLATDTISEGDRLLVGYIAKGATGIDGTITVKAYLDKAKIGISDTYDGTESDNMGTTNEWANGRTIFTTTEWNSLQQNGVSFQVKIEANEGVWVKDQIRYNANGGTVTPAYKEIEDNATTYGNLPTPEWANHNFLGWYTLATGGTKVEASTSYTKGTSPTTIYAHWEEIQSVPSCPGCRFMQVTNGAGYIYGENGTPVADITDTTSYDYNDILDREYPFFVGFTEKNGKIDRGFACGVMVDKESGDETPFCIEGTSDATRRDELVAYNRQFLTNLIGEYDDETGYGCHFYQYSPDYYACTIPTYTENNDLFAHSVNSGEASVGLSGDSGYYSASENSELG